MASWIRGSLIGVSITADLLILNLSTQLAEQNKAAHPRAFRKAKTLLAPISDIGDRQPCGKTLITPCSAYQRTSMLALFNNFSTQPKSVFVKADPERVIQVVVADLSAQITPTGSKATLPRLSVPLLEDQTLPFTRVLKGPTRLKPVKKFKPVHCQNDIS